MPWDVSCEEDLTEKVGGEVLAFAVQKVQEIVALADAVPAITSGKQVIKPTFQCSRIAIDPQFPRTCRGGLWTGRV